MSATASSDTQLSARAGVLHRAALIWDNHGCMPFDEPRRRLGELERYRNAGVNVVMINIGDGEVSLDRCVRMAAEVREFVKLHPEAYVLALTVDAVLHAQSERKLAVGLNVEGVFSIGNQLNLIDLYYDLGVRWMLMVYNRRNLAGYGCHDDVDEGLTPFGRDVIRRMDCVGMVKCCSHTGYRTAMDVLTATDRPTIFSHSNPRALWDHPRNITDELIDACAATDGVVCINGVGIFLGNNDASVATFVNHLDYVVQRVGARHAGIGLDYVFDRDGLNTVLAEHANVWPPGFGYAPGIQFLAPESLPEVTEQLLGRGYSETDVRALLGGNLLRVARAVWR
jgi:membrane dipeptidase